MEWNDGMEYGMIFQPKFSNRRPQDLYRTKAQTREGVDTRYSSLATCIHCVAKPQIIFTSLHARGKVL